MRLAQLVRANRNVLWISIPKLILKKDLTIL